MSAPRPSSPESSAPAPKVKICGLTSYRDAAWALDCGAWALGFIFHRPSARYIAPAEAARIVRRLPVEAVSVGVFVDYELEELRRVVREVGLRGAQLHGDESPEYAARVGAELVIKALRVDESFAPSAVPEFAGCTYLLDTYDPSLAGGSGRSFDWTIARRFGERAPFLLAGGLTPENVEEAVRFARPDGVDVAGGVECAPGRKDPSAVARFCDAVFRSSRAP